MSSTEYLNYESGKFSKSRGIGVFGADVQETGIPADVWRFYIFYNRPEKADALFTWSDFQEKVNSELIGNFGNLVNRTLSFVTRYYGGVIPNGAPNEAFWDTLRNYEDKIAAYLERADLRDAFRTIFELSSFANKTFQDGEPWRARVENPAAAETVIRDLCYAVRDIAVMMEPFMPGVSERTLSFFGLTRLSWADIGRDQGLEKVVKSEVLFSRLEDDLIQTLRERYSGSQQLRAESRSSEVVTEQVTATAVDPAELFPKTLDLRVAKIVKIERHPKADKLYIETLEIAGEERVIVSGLVPFYKEEELLGRHIIVAYNLKAAKLRGVESRGMLLAASDHDADGNERVEVLDAGEAPTGTRISLEGQEPRELSGEASGAPPAEIDIDTFFKIPITVRENRVEVGGRNFMAADKPVLTRIISAGEVH
jgi:methionyl-tRNA synthetase